MSPADELRSLFTSDVQVAFADLGEYDAAGGWLDLFELERLHVAGAVEKRRREFTCGRALARRVLGQLRREQGSTDRPEPIGVGPKREPLWPAGRVGSIAHTDGACVAVAANAQDVRSLGVDVEPAEPLAVDLWERVLTGRERAELAGLPAERAGLLARAAFGAKECVYKAQFPLSRAWLDFHDVEVVFRDGAAFDAHFLRVPSELATVGVGVGDVWAGRWSARTEWLLAGIELSPVAT